MSSVDPNLRGQIRAQIEAVELERPARHRIAPRLMAKVCGGSIPLHQPDLGPCLVWTGRKIWNGYGLIHWNGEQWLVHRAAYTIFVDDIPHGFDVDHLCRNRACIRGSHLEAVTRAENNRRAREYLVLRSHCPAGHPYAGDNIYISPTNGTRACLTCRRERSRRWNERVAHGRRS